MGIKKNIKELDSVVVKFVGDSGDGMQLTGTLFSDTSAIYGNDLSTFPDYPGEIRAPQNTVAGVSGFQVHIGNQKIRTYGDACDVLVAMNPASLKANIKWAKKGSTIITDIDAYDEDSLSKAGYKVNPLEDGSLASYNVIPSPITTLTKAALKDTGIDNKTAEKSKNMFALGMINYLFNRKLEQSFDYLEKKFGKKPELVKMNKIVLQAGYDFADTIEALESYNVAPAKLEKGKYRNITGNQATAWGLLAAAEKSGLQLFLGSYPITPATEIMIELTNQKSLGAKVFQAEDEIAGICSAIGASFAGSLACTTTSGPGLSLKSEALGLAVMTELPLVIVNVQRGGPSTGLPTKSEQSDLMQALYGRNGEAPMVVIAASSPSNCFDYAFEAAKIAVEHMTPVILLTDGFLGNGSQLFKIPKMADMPTIKPHLATANDATYKPYKRDNDTLARYWAAPGTEGLRHRIGGLEKENINGAVTTDGPNHQLMVQLRAEKVQRVANYIPELKVTGSLSGDLLVIGWGSTEGSMTYAVEQAIKEHKNIGYAHFNHIMPLPKNTEEVLKKYKKILVCELNMGQFASYLKGLFPNHNWEQYNKVQGLPFTITEIKEKIKVCLEVK